jgi:LysM repeat protein
MGIYTVQPGDTLLKIAARRAISVSQLKGLFST